MKETITMEESGYLFTEPIERSNTWELNLFGSEDFKYTPVIGYKPNWFVRWMSKVFLDCKWVRKPKAL